MGEVFYVELVCSKYLVCMIFFSGSLCWGWSRNRSCCRTKSWSRSSRRFGRALVEVVLKKSRLRLRFQWTKKTKQNSKNRCFSNKDRLLPRSTRILNSRISLNAQPSLKSDISAWAHREHFPITFVPGPRILFDPIPVAIWTRTTSSRAPTEQNSDGEHCFRCSFHSHSSRECRQFQSPVGRHLFGGDPFKWPLRARCCKLSPHMAPVRCGERTAAPGLPGFFFRHRFRVTWLGLNLWKSEKPNFSSAPRT